MAACPRPIDPCDLETRFAVRHADLDVVGHLNSTRYVEWALEKARRELGLK